MNLQISASEAALDHPLVIAAARPVAVEVARLDALG